MGDAVILGASCVVHACLGLDRPGMEPRDANQLDRRNYSQISKPTSKGRVQLQIVAQPIVHYTYLLKARTISGVVLVEADQAEG